MNLRLSQNKKELCKLVRDHYGVATMEDARMMFGRKSTKPHTKKEVATQFDDLIQRAQALFT